MSNNLDSRVYIDALQAKTDEELRNKIRAAGAKWDSTRKCWYYLPSEDVDMTVLQEFQTVDSETLTREVSIFLKISKEEFEKPEVKEALRSAGAKWSKDQQSWIYRSINGNIPEELARFPVIDYKDLRQKVYVKIPDNLIGTKELHEKYKGLVWDYYYEEYYVLVDPSVDPSTLPDIQGLEIITPVKSEKKTIYLAIPQAKTDEQLRTKIKELGCRWSQSYQAWKYVVKNGEIPEEIAKFPQIDKNKLTQRVLIHLDVPGAVPEAKGSKEVREILRKEGAYWNHSLKCYDFWLENGKELPASMQKICTVITPKKQAKS